MPIKPMSPTRSKRHSFITGPPNRGDGDAYFGSSQSFPVNKAVFGLSVFIATEIMFFAGLISAFIILKAGASAWPPAGQPRLPIEVTSVNTLVLLISGYTIYRAAKAVRADRTYRLNAWLLATGILGALFLGIQGHEWMRLVGYGLTLSSSTYGATFYTLIGAHGLHVFIAVLSLLFVLGRSLRRQYSRDTHTEVRLCQVYWFFVVGMWPVLYVLVYL